MSVATTATFDRIIAGGKWLRAGEQKWVLKGVSYGPFRPRAGAVGFPEKPVLDADFARIRCLGFNTVRLYEPPSEEVLRVAETHGLRLLVGIPWTDHVDFLRSRERRTEIMNAVTETVVRLRSEPCVVGFLVGNEVEKTLVRWLRPPRVRHFLETLIAQARTLAPDKLFSYATYPSTEYLFPRNADFFAINLYLEQPDALAAYLVRLQNLAGNKPLVISEFGLDTATHGAEAQARTARWMLAEARRAGVAGTVWFSYTDEWFRGDEEVVGWKFGLVDRDRQGRPVCQVFAEPEPEWAGRWPRVSVIVCTRDGIGTLKPCLESLQRLNYPDYEVLVIDDGSQTDIATIARAFPKVRYVRQEHAGLSVARNLGAELATGEILAYTDDDCLVDEDWLRFLVRGFDEPEWVAVGGPNIPPPPRNRTEAVVAAAPGAPAHVLLDDGEAEHLPGCNLAIRKSALLAVGGFRPVYRTAGDDVDICWRLREAGGKLRYVAAAMVWHHRRYRVRSYLRQQGGYGHAEALLMKDHPERFGWLGGARWCGGIYGDRGGFLDLSEGGIFHGSLGQGLFQGVYRPRGAGMLERLGGILWVVLALTSVALGWPLLAWGWMAFSLALAWEQMRLLPLPPFTLGGRDRLLLFALCWLQPLVREWRRWMGVIELGAFSGRSSTVLDAAAESTLPEKCSIPLLELAFWCEQERGREAWMDALLKQSQHRRQTWKTDDGWCWFDVEFEPQDDLSPAVITVAEYHGQGRGLVRVRGLLRFRLGSTSLYLSLILLWAGLAGVFWQGATLLLALVIALGWQMRRRLLGWLRQAAAEAGLEKVNER